MPKSTTDRQNAFVKKQKAEGKKPVRVYIADKVEAVNDLKEEVEKINSRYLK